MPRKMPARALAMIVREKFREGGQEAADEACRMIEQIHGRRKLNRVLDELEFMLDDELEAYEAARAV
jgi:hypothetical protein